MERRMFSIFTSALVFLSMTSCSKEARMRIHADWTKDPKEIFDYGCYLIAERPRNFYKDGEEGLKCIEKAANLGYRDAMRKMGGINAMGNDPKSLAIAVYWYSRAAEAGDRNAMSELEDACRYGQLGLMVDITKANSWRMRSEEQGIKDEENRLAPLKGKAENGDIKAMEELASAYEDMGEPYWKNAVNWYIRAGDAGSKKASMRMVQAYREGQLGLPRDERKSDQWFHLWQQIMSGKTP